MHSDRYGLVAIEVEARLPLTNQPADKIVCYDAMQVGEISDEFERLGAFVSLGAIRIADLATEEVLMLDSMGMYRISPDGISCPLGTYYYAVEVRNSVGDVLFTDVCATPLYAMMSATWWSTQNFGTSIDQCEYDPAYPIYLVTESAVNNSYCDSSDFPPDYRAAVKLSAIQRLAW